MTEHDISYIAGLFDARGHAWIAHPKAGKNGKRYNRLTVKVSHPDKELLEQVTAMLGYGRVYARGGKSNQWDLKLSYRQAMSFLKTILPYLKQKAELAEEAMVGAYGRTEAGLA